MSNWKVSSDHGYHGEKQTFVTTLGSIHYGAVTTTRMFRVQFNNRVEDVTVKFFNNSRTISICDISLNVLMWLEKCKAFTAIRSQFYK